MKNEFHRLKSMEGISNTRVINRRFAAAVGLYHSRRCFADTLKCQFCKCIVNITPSCVEDHTKICSLYKDGLKFGENISRFNVELQSFIWKKHIRLDASRYCHNKKNRRLDAQQTNFTNNGYSNLVSDNFIKSGFILKKKKILCSDCGLEYNCQNLESAQDLDHVQKYHILNSVLCPYVNWYFSKEYIHYIMNDLTSIDQVTSVTNPQSTDAEPISQEPANSNDFISKTVVDDVTCKVCFEAQSNIANVPCGHMALCFKCSKIYTSITCLICTSRVRSQLHVFY